MLDVSLTTITTSDGFIRRPDINHRSSSKERIFDNNNWRTRLFSIVGPCQSADGYRSQTALYFRRLPEETMKPDTAHRSLYIEAECLEADLDLLTAEEREDYERRIDATLREFDTREHRDAEARRLGFETWDDLQASLRAK